MYTSYNKLRKSSFDITPHRKTTKKLCLMLRRLILSYITYSVVCIYHIYYVSLYITVYIV